MNEVTRAIDELKVRIFSDPERSSFIEVGNLYEETLRKLGCNVVHKHGYATEDPSAADADVVLHNTWGRHFGPIPKVKNIACVVHEWSRYPSEWLKYLSDFDNIWTTTHHVKHALESSGINRLVFRVPPAVDLAPVVTHTNGGPKACFRFLYIGEHHFRKGLHVLLKAWEEAFGDSKSVRLTLKTTPGLVLPKPFENVEIIDKRITKQEIWSLYQAHDAYVSASLAEGWGLPVVEAIRSGIPVVANRWGGHGDILCQGGCIEVPYQTITQPYCSLPELYSPGQKCAWSEPTDLANALKKMFALDLEQRNQISTSAQRHLFKHYGWEIVRHEIMARLKQLVSI